MAKFTESDLFSDMRGRLGDVVFSRNEHGLYVKAYKKPTYRNTEAQQLIRQTLSYVSKLWQQLTLEQVTAWNEAAKELRYNNKQKKQFSSGHSYFIYANLNLMKAECEPLLNGPGYLSTPMGLSLFKVEVISKPKDYDILLSYEPELDEHTCMVIWATPPNTFTQPKESSFRMIGVIDKERNPGKEASSIYEMYKKKYGEIKEQGIVVGFQVEMIDKVSGRARKDWREVVKF